MSEREERRTTQGVEYENVGEEYLEQRQLQKGAAGWVLLAGLGVAYVISGEISGWQFGLAEGGGGGSAPRSSRPSCTPPWSTPWPTSRPPSRSPEPATVSPGGPWGCGEC